jgi:hypothetical protein
VPYGFRIEADRRVGTWRLRSLGSEDLRLAGPGEPDEAIDLAILRFECSARPYYGYAGYTGFFPTTTGYPYVVADKTPTGERGD